MSNGERPGRLHRVVVDAHDAEDVFAVANQVRGAGWACVVRRPAAPEGWRVSVPTASDEDAHVVRDALHDVLGARRIRIEHPLAKLARA